MIHRLFRLIAVLAAIAVLGVAAVWVLSNTDFGRKRARRFLVGVLQGNTHGIVKVAAVHGNLLSGATLVGVNITDSTGRPFLKADSISGRYVLRSFLSNRLQFTDVVAYRPDVVISKLPGEKWNYRVLWPSTPKRAPGDTLPGWGSYVRLENATILNGHITVRSPWAPRAGLTARARDSVVKDALGGGSRLAIIRVPNGFQKVVTLEKVNARLPLVRIADPAFQNRFAQVAALSMDAYPFRPPAAEIRALTGSFTFNDDSLWWKGAAVRLPNSALKGDGRYNMDNGDMRLSLAASPARFKDFRWLYDRFPADGGGTLGLTVQWKGATQDYVIRDANVRTGGAHLTGDIGVSLTDTVYFHDANLRFTGLTTKQIESLSPSIHAPRQGVLSGHAKFAGTARRMQLDADVTFAAYDRGTSHVIAQGVAGISGTPVVVSARDLHVRVTPLQMDIVKLLFPTLPLGGTLTGVATLNGNGATQLVATNIDITHREDGNLSRAVGRGSFHTLKQQTMDLDLVARPIALATITKFAPSLPFKGVATGPVHAHGPIDALQVDTRLSLPGGGDFALKGTVDFVSKELGYDVVADATRLDLSRVLIGGPSTSLNGGGRARGRGFKPATMYADVALTMGPSTFDTLGVDSLLVRARLANGLANIERAHAEGSGAVLDVQGQLGLDSRHAGALTYSIAVDSLGTFARYIPGGAGPDTGIVTPRPRLAAEVLLRAQQDSVLVDRQTEVSRVVEGRTVQRIQVDTPSAIPRGVLAGTLRASGSIRGSIDRFSVDGTAMGSGLIVRGNAARHLAATYSLTDVRTKRSRVNLDLKADTISIYGFAFDSLAGTLGYTAPSGTVALRLRQGGERDYGLNGDFTMDKAHNELRLADVNLRFDSTTWRTTHPARIRFGVAGIEVVNLELRSGPTRRIYANGLLPTKGVANFDLQVTDFAVENVAELLQSDLAITGRLDLDAHVAGTAEDPSISGRLDFVRGTYNAQYLPELHGTFSYANQQLTTDATAVDSSGRTLASINGTIPIDLALSGVTGSRLLDLPINVALMSDSLPIGLIPQFTAAVTDVSGRALGNVRVAGTLKQPSLQGDITLMDVGFRVAASGTHLQNVYGRVRMTGDTVYVDSIAGRANGPVRISGTVAVGNWREPSFNLFLTASDALLLDSDRGKVFADAGLRASGSLLAPYVSGQVTVTHGVIYIPESRKQLVGAGDPALFNVIDTALAVQSELFPAQSSMFKNLKVDVDLAVQRNTWVRSRDANVEIFTDGPLRVSVVGDALTLTGAVDADRGEYSFLGKRFQIKRGSALFIGTPDLNPTLQITAEYQVKQATGATNIRVLIGGTVESPRISLESDAQPPLSQSDLLSYLAFGERSNSLLQFNQTSLSATQGGGLLNVAGTRLAGIAIGVALDEVEGTTARSLGLDVFNITPGDVPVFAAQGGLDVFLKGTEIEAGKYVNPRTFVSLVVTPGLLTCGSSRGSSNSSCAPPGATFQHRTPRGFRYEAAFSPRYILDPPTLAGQTFSGTSQFGVFVIREWRF